MSLPDIDNLTPAQLVDLMGVINRKLAEAQQNAEQTEADRRTAITQAKTTLRALLGPEDAPAGIDSIRAVAAFPDATIAQHQQVFNRLVLNALEALTDTQLDTAEVIGT